MGFLFNRPIMLLDDRRSSVPLLRLGEFRRTLGTRPAPARELSERLRSFMLARGRRLTFGGIVNEVLLGVCVLTALVMPIMLFGIVGPLGLLTMLVGVPAAFSYFSRETGERRYRRQLGASYVAEGVCGSCGYSLRGLVREDDGCVVCPECGGAWSEDRIVAPVWDAERPSLPPEMHAWKRFAMHVPRRAMRTIGDARGRLVPVADPNLRVWRTTRDPEALAPARGALKRVGLTWRIVVALLALVPWSGVVSLVVLSLREDAPMGALEVVVGALLLVLGAGIVLASVRGDLFRPPRTVAKTLLRFALCPACGDDLQHGRHLADRCTVCRTCGATWTPPGA